MSIDQNNQLRALLSRIGALENQVKDLQERVQTLERKDKERKTLSLKNDKS